jgi:hypothetical protein
VDREVPIVEQSTLEWHPPGARKPLTIDLVRMFETVSSKMRR